MGVRNKNTALYFSGTSPADVKHAIVLGIYPAVLEYNLCGRVLQASSGYTFQPGDLVGGYTIHLRPSIGLLDLVLINDDVVCPDDMAFLATAKLLPQHAACLTVVAMTAADALYNIFNLHPPYEKVNHQLAIQALLIWGASSSVGFTALQFARASDVYSILVTASPEQYDLLLELGATRCFDYKSPSVSFNIRAAVKDRQWGALTCGFDAVGNQNGNMSSAKLMAGYCSEDATLVSVVVQSAARFQMPLTTRNRDVVIKPLSSAWGVLRWAVEHYCTHFRSPSVDVFEGTAEEALEELKATADHGRGFGKLVLKNPLQ
ncbi:hypothetical protein BDV59DRAFT_207211 [Aspergillus ambiguus]|uniref:uncharacterized protein n=1 Tax=Aspergillus ambiguus TaxID=176160 RepID=UPI003CCD4A6D